MPVANAVGLALLLWISASPGRADDAILEPSSKRYTFAEDLKGAGKTDDGKDKPAYDVSGIACILKASGKRRCLVVNDEGRKGQFLTIDDRTIEPKKEIALIGKTPSEDTLGTMPTTSECPDRGEPKFKEFDGEGVAYAEPYFYVVGSHGCSRKSGKLKTSALILARIRVDGDGKPDVEDDGEPEAAVETTYRLGDALARTETVRDFRLKSLTEENGLNIEGVAVVKGRLYAGLRAPSLDGRAFLVGADVDALFASGHGSYQGNVRKIPLTVGKGAGIRDLSALPDGRLLVLTGPAREQPDVPYKLFLFDPSKETGLQDLGALAELDDPERCGKAEAVAAVGRNRVMVLFDSLRNGGPHDYKVPATLMEE